MHKLMGRFVFLLLLSCMLVSVSMAEEKRITLENFSFIPPETLIAQPLTEEAAKGGVVYAAENEDASLRLVLVCAKVRRGSDTSVSALIARQASVAGVVVEKPIAVDGYEFVVSTETVEDAERSVTFRLVTSVVRGNQLVFFFIDRTGGYAEIPRQVVESFLVTKQEEIKP